MSEVFIKDPNGGDASALRIVDGHALTQSFTETEFEHTSEHDSLAFTWTIVAADFEAATTLLLLQNNSDDLILHIDHIVVSTDNASIIQIHVIDAAATLSGGTAVVGFCLNRKAPRLATTLSTARSNETGNSTQGTIVVAPQILASTPIPINFGGAIGLPNGAAIGVDLVTASTSLATCTITGHYKEI